MFISIALATYNGEKYLSEQLESILNQSRVPDELVVTDDCSSDDTLKILTEFASVAPFDVVIFRNRSNKGHFVAFNNSLLNTRGDVVFFCDQDDVWFGEKIEVMSGLLNPHEPAALICDAVITNENLEPIGITNFEMKAYRTDDVDKWALTGCSTVYTRSLIDAAVPISWFYKGKDKYLSNFSSALGVVCIHSSPLQYWRRHGNNVSKQVVDSGLGFFSDSGSPKRSLFDKLKLRLLSKIEPVALQYALWRASKRRRLAPKFKKNTNNKGYFL